MRLVLWLMLPYGVSILCFAAAFAIMSWTGTNRTIADLNSGTVGFGFLAIGLICTAVMLFTFPYREATSSLWWAFAGHFVLIMASLVIASSWLAAHIA